MTGYPFIDANMIELKTTGFMSNRGRQVVASFLINDLNINWIYGAEYFESMLIDYDCASNYGNWNYIAGVGVDPRPSRYFNVYKQAKNYDKQAKYMKHWLPQLQQESNIDLINADVKGYIPKCVKIRQTYAHNKHSDRKKRGYDRKNQYIPV